MRRGFGLVVLWSALGGVAAAQLEGRVVMSGAERADVLVSLERETGQIVHQTFTSSRGTFFLDGVSLFTVSNNNPVYIVINEEGYKPYRRRLQQLDFRSGGSIFTVYLERDDREPVRATGGEDGDALTVDVRQLVTVPDTAVGEYDDALEESGRGNYERAAEHLERAVEIAPNYYNAWIDLGGQYDRLGRYGDARHAYLEASEVNPAGALALLNLGALYYQQGEREREDNDTRSFGTFSLAEEWLEKAVEIDPASAEARFYLGATLYRLDSYGEAEDALQGAIAIDDDYADAHLLLINVYTRQSRYEAALEQADAFLQQNPDAAEREEVERVRAQIEVALGRQPGD